VLFDAVAILVSQAGTEQLSTDAATKNFISDAYAHLKFIAYTGPATPLLEKARIGTSLDEGFIPLNQAQDITKFLTACKQLRLWSREPHVKISHN
jgi:catalase